MTRTSLVSFVSPPSLKPAKPLKGRRRELTEEENDEIKEAFDLFDNDKDNELDYHEFKVCSRSNRSAVYVDRSRWHFAH